MNSKFNLETEILAGYEFKFLIKGMYY